MAGVTRVVLSPHLDDAVWSCGGALAGWRAAGHAVTVVTVFDGDGEPPRTAARWTPPAVRRAENAHALARLGVRDRRLGWPEALLRKTKNTPRYRGPLVLRRSPHPDDEALVGTLADALAPLVAGEVTVLAPVGTGTHVDHVLVRRAADLAVPADRLRYYAEFPYSPDTAGLVARGYRVDFGAWLRSACGYRSQVEAMFGGPLPFARALAKHGRRRPGGPAWWDEWRRNGVAT